ncbi:MAG: hypothetical protein LBT30_06620 [Clostridiales bacterium]|jgi:Tfp pilus assembly protein PilF|nr:hypothetical protein [Clostridiales bacterium]
MKQDSTDSRKELALLCCKVRTLMENNESGECEALIKDAMSKYPHAPEPHNLFGLLLEVQGDHLTAMKHFRAAWALDPTYIPARKNLEHFGNFCPSGSRSYGETKAVGEVKDGTRKIEYDKNGIGRV